jgi:hypothetical protein
MRDILSIADQHLEPDVAFLEIEKERWKDLRVLHQLVESADLPIQVVYGNCENDRRRSLLESAQSTHRYFVLLDLHVGAGRTA